ncbi:hypothetical protein PIB30_079866 [Stylosanthes scabra]|uniref:Uncharacterized protein n=1 Tax=Stylosanthes scabra TaxID=79078 RepID=A0ABU6WPJ1_9FABA|nr:hypothetical protein [Stylosanthes scabra]
MYGMYLRGVWDYRRNKWCQDGRLEVYVKGSSADLLIGPHNVGPDLSNEGLDGIWAVRAQYPEQTPLFAFIFWLSPDALARHRPYHCLRLDVTSPTSQDSSLPTLWLVTALTIAFVLTSRVQRAKTCHQKPPHAPSRAARRSLVDLLRFSSRSFSSCSICGADQRSRSCHVLFHQHPSLTRLPNLWTAPPGSLTRVLIHPTRLSDPRV